MTSKSILRLRLASAEEDVKRLQRELGWAESNSKYLDEQQDRLRIFIPELVKRYTGNEMSFEDILDDLELIVRVEKADEARARLGIKEEA